MALCDSCKECFTKILNEPWIGELKTLAELSGDDVMNIHISMVKGLYEESMNTATDVASFIHRRSSVNVVFKRSLETVIQQRHHCWLCCWICVQSTINQPENLLPGLPLGTDANKALSEVLKLIRFTFEPSSQDTGLMLAFNRVNPSFDPCPLGFKGGFRCLRDIPDPREASRDEHISSSWLSGAKSKPLHHLTYKYSMPQTDGNGSGNALVLDEIIDPFKGIRTSITIGHSGCDTTQLMCQCRITKIRGWLSECRATHKACNKNFTDALMLPKRLLRVNKVSHIVQVVETEQIPHGEKVEYATLSHCWGSRQPLVLTTLNYSSFLNEIPFDQLGKTVSEAIELCRELDIGYLWIDCFCIIQDSPQDWYTEAPRMQHVYGNSVLNLAAAASRSSDEGFWRSKNTILSHSIEIKLQHFTLRENIGTNTATKNIAHDKSPLFQRGWVLQECILPSRVLYSTEHQLVWHCRQLHAAELEAEKELFKTGFRFRIYGGTRITNEMPIHTAQTVEDLDLAWKRIVRGYSSTVVTRPEDRYYALSGLAALTEQRYKQFGIETRYMAGIWEHNIVFGLLWNSRDSLRAPGIIPSWSWLKCIDFKSGITYGRDFRKRPSEKNIMRYLCGRVERLKHASIYGPVKVAALQLEAHFFTIIRTWTSGSCSAYLSSGQKMTASLPGLHELIFDHSEDSKFGILTVCVVWREGIPFAESEALTQQRQPNYRSYRVSALILEPHLLESGEDDTMYKGCDVYRRIGTFELASFDSSDIVDSLVLFFADDNLLKKKFWLV